MYCKLKQLYLRYGLLLLYLIDAVVVSDTGLFFLVVVSLVELQVKTTGIVITIETMRSMILPIVFPLLDIIILIEALVSGYQ